LLERVPAFAFVAVAQVTAGLVIARDSSTVVLDLARTAAL